MYNYRNTFKDDSSEYVLANIALKDDKVTKTKKFSNLLKSNQSNFQFFSLYYLDKMEELIEIDLFITKYTRLQNVYLFMGILCICRIFMELFI